MFDEPDDPSERRRDDAAADPAERANEKANEFRMHAELAAVYEGPRKFDNRILPRLSPDVARDVQKRIAKLERSRSPESPILPPASVEDAAALLAMPEADDGPSAGDYHVSRRPGEVMVVRWLAGDDVDAFYGRLQAHFDAALEGFREDERQALGWKQDPKTLAYLDALDKVEVKMADRYLRELIKAHGLFVLSTQAADEIDVLYLAETLMGVSPVELVGAASAPPEDGPAEQDRAWFFKLFSLRGFAGGVERMCFFTFMQKADDTFGLD